MKILLLVLVMLLFAYSASAEPMPELPTMPENVIPATVTRVVDGDTIIACPEGGEDTRVRLIGIDTPESVHPNKDVEFYALEASDFATEALEGASIYLEKDVSDTDRYGRMLAYVWTEDGELFNARLVLDGYARVSTYPPDVKYAELFVACARYAYDGKLGLWAEY